MQWSEIQSKSTAELTRELAAARERLRQMRFQISQGQHKQMHQVHETKQLIARILTKMTKDQSTTKSS